MGDMTNPLVMCTNKKMMCAMTVVSRSAEVGYNIFISCAIVVISGLMRVFQCISSAVANMGSGSASIPGLFTLNPGDVEMVTGAVDFLNNGGL